MGEDPGQTQDRVTIQEAVRGASLESQERSLLLRVALEVLRVA